MTGLEMGAWRVVARMEGRLIWRDRAVWMTAAALVLALGAAWISAWTWTTGHQTRIEVLLREQDTRLRDLQQRIDKERAALLSEAKPLAPVLFGSRHGTSVGHYSGQRWMVQPVLPTAPLALGELDLQPLGHLASVDRWQGQARAEPSSPLWQRFPRFDVLFVLAYLLPLSIIVTCAGAVSAEREAGTLRLRAAQGGGGAALGFGRVIARGGLLTGVAVAVVVAGAWTNGGFAAGSWPYLALWTAACVAYAAFWLSIVLWVDSWGQSTGVNLLVCAGCWLLLLFVAPGVVRVAADWTRPVTSRAAFEQARRQAYQDTWGTLTNRDVLAAFYASRPDISPARDQEGSLERYCIYQMRLLETMRETLLPLEETLDRYAAANRDLIRDLRFASPLLMLHDVTSIAAGTDVGRLEDFLTQRGAFFDEWDAFYVSRIYSREPIEDLAATPAFVYTEPSLASRTPAILSSLLGLLLPALACAWLARRGYRRLPV
jgi:hypothetical protein